VCALTGATTYREAWDLSVGESTSWIPAWACTIKTGVANVAYSMILADTFQNLFSTAGLNLSRSTTLLGITSTVLLPLCLLKDLASLAPFSLLGIIGMAYTTLAMAIRYFGGSYSLPAGKLLSSLAASKVPKFGNAGASAALSPNSAILVCMLSTAYLAHYNAPKYFVELKDNTIERFNQVVKYGFAASMSMFVAVTAFGFLTFGKASQGLILNNYANGDVLAGASRVAVAVSVVFSYPLAFVGIRDGILDLTKFPREKRTNSNLDRLSVALLSVVTALALKLKDLSFVLSFGGATLGNAIIFVFPALMFRAVAKKSGKDDMKREVNFAMLVAALGVALGVVGGKMALASV